MDVSKLNELISNSTDGCESTTEESAEVVPTVKKRGRPRKQPAPVESLASLVTPPLTSLPEPNFNSPFIDSGFGAGRQSSLPNFSKSEALNEPKEVKKAAPFRASSVKRKPASIPPLHPVDDDGASDRAKTEKIHRLNKYYQYFPDLKSAHHRSPFGLNEKELDDELRRCQICLDTEDCLDTVKKLDILSMWITEIGLNNLGYPVHGLVPEAKATQHIVEKELKELSIKYNDWIQTGPEFRYMMKCVNRITNVIAGLPPPQFMRQPTMYNYEKGKDEKYNSL